VNGIPPIPYDNVFIFGRIVVEPLGCHFDATKFVGVMGL
jgi:hypothetical protein